MQGVLRNNGLHFTVGKNAYSYKIPKKTGDVLTDKDDHFTVSDDGGYWKVTLNDNRDNNYNLWKGTFTIKDADGINITYTVYHTGIFHEITDDMASKYELAEDGVDSLKVKGMFYYGVVKVEGKNIPTSCLTVTWVLPKIVLIYQTSTNLKTIKVLSVDTSRFQRIRMNQMSSRGIYPLLYLLKALKYQRNRCLRT